MALSLVPDPRPEGDPPEVRVDPLSGARVVIVPGRATELAPPAPRPVDEAADPWLPGREAGTGEELERIDDGAGSWLARAVVADAPAWIADPPAPAADSHRDLFGAAEALGAHEVLVNAPGPVGALADLDDAQVAVAVELWRARLRAHAPAACNHLHVDERPDGGAPAHTHAELHALTFVPAGIARERERFGAHATRTMGSDLLGDVVQEEVRRRRRLVAYDDDCVLLAPWASRSPYELMIAPRRPGSAFEAEGQGGAAMLHQALRRLAVRFDGSPPLSLWVRTTPRGAERFTWRIVIVPRLVAPDGLELGTGVPANPVAPERAAAELKAATG